MITITPKVRIKSGNDRRTGNMTILDGSGKYDARWAALVYKDDTPIWIAQPLTSMGDGKTNLKIKLQAHHAMYKISSSGGSLMLGSPITNNFDLTEFGGTIGNDRDFKLWLFDSYDELVAAQDPTIEEPASPTAARPSRDQTMMEVAKSLELRSTCRRRSVGAVLVDNLGRILATGHNGVPMDDDHCLDVPCPGVDLPSGTGLERCRAVHAEMNALLFCPDVMKIDTLYTTTSPCLICVRMLLNTSCQQIVYHALYDQEAMDWWHDRGRRSTQL